MKKVGICGHYGNGQVCLDGQTIKTKNITAALKGYYGTDDVLTVDTHGGLKKLPYLILNLFKLFRSCENIVILPAQNGLRIIVPICAFYRSIFHRKLHYVVIGGWLPSFLQTRNKLLTKLKKFDGIYVETQTMRTALIKMGFDNISIIPNFKNIKVLTESELIYTHQKPYPLCTFSRVMKEKGIEDAVDMISKYNQQEGEVVFSLDIYGTVDQQQKEWFDSLQKAFPDYIKYKGIIPAELSVSSVKNYYALLFPTRFYTEGIPGTIIDAYSAGVPVIAAKWESFADVIDDKATGIGFEFGNMEEFSRILDYIANHEPEFNQLKKQCLQKSLDFSPDKAITPLIHTMGGNPIL